MSLLPNTSADYDAFRDMVMSRSIADKVALVRELEKETFPSRFLDLLKSLRSRISLPLPMEEITKEVDAVRAARYTKGN
jgi:hypothetical protein